MEDRPFNKPNINPIEPPIKKPIKARCVLMQYIRVVLLIVIKLYQPEVRL